MGTWERLHKSLGDNDVFLAKKRAWEQGVGCEMFEILFNSKEFN